MLAALLLAIVAGALRGEVRLIVGGLMAAALSYAIYLQVVWLVLLGRHAAIENKRLVITRGSGGTALGSVELEEPFRAKCLHYDGTWALYRVTQRQTVLRFAVSRHDPGDVVKAIGLAWPPSTTPYGSWLR